MTILYMEALPTVKLRLFNRGINEIHIVIFKYILRSRKGKLLVLPFFAPDRCCMNQFL